MSTDLKVRCRLQEASNSHLHEVFLASPRALGAPVPSGTLFSTVTLTPDGLLPQALSTEVSSVPTICSVRPRVRPSLTQPSLPSTEIALLEASSGV